MTIVMIKMHEGKLTAIMDDGTGVTLDMIDGGVRTGAVIQKSGERWKVIGDQTDIDCPSGVCDWAQEG